jgi:hypothetical protein
MVTTPFLSSNYPYISSTVSPTMISSYGSPLSYGCRGYDNSSYASSNYGSMGYGGMGGMGYGGMGAYGGYC